MSGYNYEVEYVKIDKNIADWLPRLPNESQSYQDYDIDIDYSFFLYNSKDFKLNFGTIRTFTLQDRVFRKIKDCINKLWSNKLNDPDLKPFFAKRKDFYSKDDCVMWNHRIVVPFKLYDDVLNQLHCKMQNLAWGYFWFPSMDIRIQSLTNSSLSCIHHSSNPPKVAISPCPTPNGPWERLHIDFFELIKINYLVVIDAFSKWLEVFRMSSINFFSTISILRQLYARFGLPNLIVSDNGPSFVSLEFENFLINNNIKHITCAPYHPISNDAAENSVKTIKITLKNLYLITTLKLTI